MQEERTCPNCGGTYIAESNYRERKYCSRECAYAGRRAQGRTERICRTCGKAFTAKNVEIKRRGGKYCSRECWRANPPRTGAGPEAAARMRVERKGAGNPAYVGDKASFATAHDRIRAQRGKASEYPCAECGGQAYDWALSKDAEAIRTAPNGRRYSLNVDDYMPMCRRCHVHYDHDGVFPRHFGANAHWGEAA